MLTAICVFVIFSVCSVGFFAFNEYRKDSAAQKRKMRELEQFHSERK